MPRTIVITGASDGIGAASARQLHEAGETVVIVGRDPRKTAAVAGPLGVDSYIADYSDLSQVHELAAALLNAYPQIDVLANNAGGVFGDRALTTDGYELTFQVNHLGGFLLTNLLLERLVHSRATVIQTSSEAARRFANFDLENLQGEKKYSAGSAYGNAKLENILFTKELNRRFGDAGISAVSFHPGVIGSSFAAGAKGPWRFMYTNPLTKRLMDSTDMGGSRLTWLALGKPGVDWELGAFYSNNRVGRTNRVADDPAAAKILWDRSAEMVGLA